MLHLFVTPFVCLMAYATLLFVYALQKKNNGIADVGYGGAFMVVTLVSLLVAPAVTLAGLILAVLVVVWGVRLVRRIHRKNSGKPEDFRYRAWREAWGSTFVWRSYLQIYILQACIAFVIVIPVTATILLPRIDPNTLLFTSGLIVWCVGFFFESVGDAQLDAFIGNPENKGKIMTSGLWKYTRHPNYFGESTMWWGIAIMACTATSLSFLVFVSPLIITYLLLFVSGIPMLEKRWAGNPEWEAYKAKTSAFIPLPPRK